MTVEIWPIDRVKPYSGNPRKIPASAVAKVAASIATFNWKQPLVVEADGTIVVGHTRMLAAQKLKLATVPVVVATDLTPEQVRAYRLADNRTNQEAEWDLELLAVEMSDLAAMAVDLSSTAFDESEIEKLIAKAGGGQTDEDATPEVEEVVVTRTGDIWLLGEHRLLCGDSTNGDAVRGVLAGGLADMVFTDPPYNVNYGATMKDKLRGKARAIKNDDLGEGFEQFLYDACVNVLAVTKGAIYICMSPSELHTLQKAFREAGGHWSTFVIWAKNTFTMGRSDYQRQYEPILYGWKEGTDHFWCGARDQGDVWFIKKPHINDLHPTMKPVELVERALRNSSKNRDTVLDPFGGSGSTMIACEKTGRRARLIELDPHYCDVIIRRWQAFSGRRAVLMGGSAFDDVAMERLPAAA